jgi:Alcohol dehydrogenase GroES-like domain./Zinc-binding dehydrogenase.
MKVKAAVVNRVGEPYKIEEVKLGEMRPDEVLVRMVASGICHTDEACRSGDSPFPFPAIFGHEGAGIIEKVGDQVKDFEAGDQVILSYSSCGVCPNCRQGKPYSCLHWNQMNMAGTRLDGSHVFFKDDGTPISNFFGQSAFASYSIVHQSNLIKVPKDVDLRLYGPLGCGLLTGSGAVNDVLKPDPGSSIAIFGTGAVGFGAVMAAVLRECSPIIAVDIHDSRLEMAKALGATHTINSLKEDVKERISEITGGLGVHYSIDTTGVSAVMETAVQVLAEGGFNVPLAVTKNTLTIHTTVDVAGFNRTIVGVKMGRNVPQLTIPKLVKFHEEGKFPLDKLVRFYKFEDINRANEDSKSGKTIKPIIIIDEEYRKEKPLV